MGTINDYIIMMQQKENLCRSYMEQAESVRRKNGGKASKEEVTYLQQAINLRAEMARASVGDEALYQQRQMNDLNLKIRTLVKEIDPDYYDSYLNPDNKKSAGKAAGTASKQGGNNGNENSTGAEDKKDTLKDQVEGWKKSCPKTTFEDVSGMDDVKSKLMECIEDSKRLALKNYFDIRQLRSYFFVGPPGCGKTFIIKAFVHELMDENYTYFSLEGSDILSRYVGDAEKIIARLFEEAEKCAPSIVFIDEIDSVCKNRSTPNLPEYASSMTTSFLVGYNRIVDSDKKIIFIGATNYPRQVDNAMMDRVELIKIGLPDKDARAAALKRGIQKYVELEDGLTCDCMAEIIEMYNYRDIDRLVDNLKHSMIKDLEKLYPNDENAAIEALQNKTYKLTKALFDQVQSTTPPTPKADILKEQEAWEKEFIAMKQS